MDKNQQQTYPDLLLDMAYFWFFASKHPQQLKRMRVISLEQI